MRRAIAAFVAALACGASTATATPMWSESVVARFPHDTSAFTEGLVFRHGLLYEGTGLEGASRLRIVRLASGEVVRERRLTSTVFGEGVALWRDRIIQLTWKSERGYVWDRRTLAPRRQFTYRGEGWGLTNDGTRLVMSNGSDELRFLDPDTLRPTGMLRVRDGDQPVRGLNELEMVGRFLYANVWPSSRIAVINPRSGRVRGWLDLTDLPDSASRRGADVLNGIAWDAAKKRLLITGKFWPKIYQIDVRDARGRPVLPG
jgi:glutaminyl-peptide cyclotransferase